MPVYKSHEFLGFSKPIFRMNCLYIIIFITSALLFMCLCSQSPLLVSTNIIQLLGNNSYCTEKYAINRDFWISIGIAICREMHSRSASDIGNAEAIVTKELVERMNAPGYRRKT